MSNRYDTTITSITQLINSLNSSRNFYGRVLRLNVDYIEFVKPLFRQKEEMLSKLLTEYKRLTNKDYLLNFTPAGYLITYNNVGILDECLHQEKHLIELYTETIELDVLWEVLPLLAHHLNQLKASKNLLINYIDDYKIQNHSIQIDFTSHPALVN